MYGENIDIIRPKEYLFTPSNAQNLVTSNFVVESISGDPKELELQTVFQDYPAKAYTPIYGVEEIKVEAQKHIIDSLLIVDTIEVVEFLVLLTETLKFLQKLI